MNAEQIRQNSHNGVDAAMDHFESAAAGVETAIAHGKEQALELQRQAAECARQAMETTDQFVQERPWQAIGIAAAVGVIAGLLISRR